MLILKTSRDGRNSGENMGRISENVIDDVNKPVNELLEELYRLRKELNNLKRTNKPRRKGPVDTGKIELSSKTVREAMIYSENLRPPKAKRR